MPNANKIFLTYYNHSQAMQNVLDELIKAHSQRTLEFSCSLNTFADHFDDKKYISCFSACNSLSDENFTLIQNFNDEIMKTFFSSFMEHPQEIKHELEYIVSCIYPHVHSPLQLFRLFTESINHKKYDEAALNLLALENKIFGHCSFEYLVSVFLEAGGKAAPNQESALEEVSFLRPRP